MVVDLHSEYYCDASNMESPSLGISFAVLSSSTTQEAVRNW